MLSIPKSFNLYQVNGTEIEQQLSDGFINATAMCAAHGKEALDWLRIDETFSQFEKRLDKICTNLAILQDLKFNPKKRNGTNYSKVFPELVKTKRGSPANGGGVWVHSDFSLILNLWLERPKRSEKLLDLKVFQTSQEIDKNIQRLKPKNHVLKINRTFPEKKIVSNLNLLLGGVLEVQTPSGNIDILTETELIEVKNFCAWKSGIGQLIVYGKYYPKHTKRLHLFNVNPESNLLDVIKEHCDGLDILLTF